MRLLLNVIISLMLHAANSSALDMHYFQTVGLQLEKMTEKAWFQYGELPGVCRAIFLKFDEAANPGSEPSEINKAIMKPYCRSIVHRQEQFDFDASSSLVLPFVAHNLLKLMDSYESVFYDNRFPDTDESDMGIVNVSSLFNRSTTTFGYRDIVVTPISCLTEYIKVIACLPFDDHYGYEGTEYSVVHQGAFTNNGTLFRYRDVSTMLFEPSSAELPPFFARNCSKKGDYRLCTGESFKCNPFGMDKCSIETVIVDEGFSRVTRLIDSYIVAHNQKIYKMNYYLDVMMKTKKLVLPAPKDRTLYKHRREPETIESVKMDDFTADDLDELSRLHANDKGDTVKRLREMFPKKGTFWGIFFG